MLLDRSVQVGHIRLMVLVVVQLHGCFIDVGLQRRIVIGQRWKFVGHGHSPILFFGNCFGQALSHWRVQLNWMPAMPGAMPFGVVARSLESYRSAQLQGFAAGFANRISESGSLME